MAFRHSDARLNIDQDHNLIGGWDETACEALPGGQKLDER